MNRTLTHLVIAVVVLALSIAAYVAAYLFVGSIGTKVVEAQKQIATKTVESEGIRKASTALSALVESEARVKSYFVPTDGIVPFLEEIGQTGSSLGANVIVVGVTEKGEVDGVTAMTLALRIEGSFASVMRTVGSLEFAPYDIALTNLSLDAGEETWGASATYEVGAKAP